MKTQSEGERREKGKEVGSTSIPLSHSPLIGYFNLLNAIGLNLNILFILPFCYFSSFYYVLDIGLYRANNGTGGPLIAFDHKVECNILLPVVLVL